jgi:GNAT superfamily N-acetyltransferase
MRQTYMIKDPDKGIFAAAIADVVLMRTSPRRQKDYVITRINVMERYRGQGLGTEILEMIFADADAEGIDLLLEPVASGGLTQQQLIDWYTRHGFTYDAWYMIRNPNC